MTTPLRRTAAYMNRLSKIGNSQSYLKTLLENEQNLLAFRKDIETRRCRDLEKAYTLIENAANKGYIRIFESGIDVDVIFDKEIQRYLTLNGFTYTYNSIEWHDTDQLK